MTTHTRPKRDLPILAALNWAFGSEMAQLEADELGETAHGGRQSVDGIWLMMQRGQVGCQVDGGGRSEPAWDAQVIASQLAALPREHGGFGMAAQVASLARAGMAPDWMKGASPRCVARDMRQTKWGQFARTEIVETITTVHRGRKHQRHIVCCPVTYRPTWAQIGAARRNYLDWFGALLWLGAELRSLDILSTIRITDAMPPMEPWR